MNKQTTTQGNRRSPRLWASALVAGSALLLAGCGATRATTDPTMTEDVKDDRNAVKATLIFREYKSSIYVVEYEGKRYLHNSNGGIVEIK